MASGDWAEVSCGSVGGTVCGLFWLQASWPCRVRSLSLSLSLSLSSAIDGCIYLNLSNIE